MAAVTAVVPSHSQIQVWSTDHLETAATHWTQAADTWEHAFTSVHRETPNPGGTRWEGAAADAAGLRTGTDRVVVVGAADSLHAAAQAARYGADEIAGARQLALQAIDDARAAGFTVGEDLSVTTRAAGPPAAMAARQAQAQAFATAIGASAQNLVAVDAEVAGKVSAAIAGVNSAQFDDAPVTPTQQHKPEIQAVDFHGTPLPERPKLPKPEPTPPPDGWSDDPLMRAAQKIAYGHAFDDHGAAEFPGMTKDQLADLIYQKMQRAMNDPRGLQLGASRSDGAPVIYDPKDNVMIVRDSRGAGDLGTVFKPELAEDPNFVQNKFAWRESILPPGQLIDAPPPAPPVEPKPPALPEPIPRGGLLGGALPDNALPHLVELPPPGGAELPVIGDGKADVPEA